LTQYSLWLNCSVGAKVKMPKKIPLTDEFIQQVKQLYDQDLGARKIAKNLGVTRDLVQNAYKVLGLYNIGRLKPRTAYKAKEKRCKRCEQVKVVKEFRKRFNTKTGRTSYEVYCLLCEKDYNSEKYYEDLETSRAYMREWNKNNRKTINAYESNRTKSDINFKLRKRVSSSIYQALLRTNNRKTGSILKYLPYPIKQLRRHLEAQFELWMTWENFGKYESKTWNDNDTATQTWNIDHIIPQSKLPYTSMEDDNFKKCWALENLRPLSAKQNILDGNRRIV